MDNKADCPKNETAVQNYLENHDARMKRLHEEIHLCKNTVSGLHEVLSRVIDRYELEEKNPDPAPDSLVPVTETDLTVTALLNKNLVDIAEVTTMVNELGKLLTYELNNIRNFI